MRLIGWLFLVLLLSALWTAVFFSPIPLPLALALVPTAVVVLFVAVVLLVGRWQARRSAQAIERTLQAQGEAQAKTARPDLRPEVAEMRAEFTKAVSALKSSKLSRGGVDALSVLPWYLIVGPPGVGKTTALINSGLKFPYLSAGGGVKGVGGTRNCQWWLTNEAVILDTAGRYTTEDDDRPEWLSFLDTLAKARPRRPINGLLVAVSVAALVELDGEAAAALGQQIRERIDEIMGRLEMIVPVYVIFNKCDLLAGFVEMFGDLPKADRSQIWGFTEPLGTASEAGELFAHRFDELQAALETQALRRLGQARRLEDRERIFQFPAQFEALRESATELIKALFEANVYQDAPLLRGAYFTSATQEGRPIDRVMQAMSQAFGVGRGFSPAETRPPQAKSYFLADLFNKVIFPDQTLAVRSSRQTRRDKQRRYLYAAAAFACAALLLVLPTQAFRRSLETLERASEALQRQKPDRAAGLAGLSGIQQLVSSLLAEQEQHRLSLGFGMDRDQALLDLSAPLYAEWGRYALIQPAADAVAADLRQFVASQAGVTERLPRDRLRYLESLKLHLLLSPHQPGEPPLDAEASGWAAGMLADAWTAKTRRAAEHDLAQAQAALYLKLMARDPRLALPRDAALVDSSREVLRRLDIADLALYQTLQESEKACQADALSLSAIVGGALPQLRANRSVRGSFTKACFDSTLGPKLRSGIKVADSWVLGPLAAAAAGGGDASDRVSGLYFEQYIAEWRKFLEAVEITQPSDTGQLLDLMDGLTAGDPAPLGRLFNALGTNTRIASLFALPFSLGPASAHRASAKDVQSEFEALVRFGEKPAGGAPPTALDKYQQALRGVLDALRADAQNPQPAGKGGPVDVVQAAIVQTEGLIGSQQLTWWQPPLLKQLLLAPLQVAGRTQREGLVRDLNQRWCNAVYLEFNKSLGGRYPFDPQGVDATLADVAAYFRPQDGTLWAFYQAALQTEVPRLGGSFRPANGKASEIFGGSLLEHLSRSQDLTNGLFPSNTKELNVPFAVNVHPSSDFDSMRLTVNGQVIDYRNGPETWPQLKWPTEGNASGATLTVHSVRGESAELTQAGEWGLFRLLEKGSLKSRDATGFTAGWRFAQLSGSPEVAIDFRPARSQNPFLAAIRPGERAAGLLRPFRAPGVSPPPGVNNGAPPCR